MKFEPLKLESHHKVAFMMSPRLGDSLLSMIVANNLVRNNIEVNVFGDYIYSLKEWFPWIKIHPKIKQDENRQEILSEYDWILYAFEADILNASFLTPNSRVVEHSPYNWQTKSMADIQVDFCQHELNLKEVVRQNNIQLPKDKIYQKNKKRVVIHPTSHEILKNWLPERFLQVAKILKSKGFEPVFLVSPNERKDWLWLIEQNQSLPEFDSLDAVANYIYESGWFIGNDSGVGHLASNLGIPTLTLGIRAKMLKRWRPSWSKGKVLLPPAWLITRPLKERFWKYTISVNRVIKAFEELSNNEKYA